MRAADLDSFGDMSALDHQLRSVLDAHQLPCGAIFAPSGAVLARIGDFDAYGGKGLVSSIVGSYGSPENIHSYLKGKILPQILGQGHWFAFLDKPSEDILVAVFGPSRDKFEVLQQYDLSKAISRTIAHVFANSGPNQITGTNHGQR